MCKQHALCTSGYLNAFLLDNSNDTCMLLEVIEGLSRCEMHALVNHTTIATEGKSESKRAGRQGTLPPCSH